MKIYILLGSVDWECETIISVHYSNEEAEEARVKDKKDDRLYNKYDDYNIEEHEIK